MPTEAGAGWLANMSAPPRSVVTLPRLGVDAAAASTAGQGAGPVPSSCPDPGAQTGERDAEKIARATNMAMRALAVGPGGGQRLSHALCVAVVDLPTALCAFLRVPFSMPSLGRPLGLTRALVAVARQARPGLGSADHAAAAREELARVGKLGEAALVEELLTLLPTAPWPGWVPRVACARPLGRDIAQGRGGSRPPSPPPGVDCPLLAARLVSAVRGAVFLRDAAPALTHLLTLWGGEVVSGSWQLWLPVRPGQDNPMRTQPSTLTPKGTR
jgi:hypothetical protein